jgi:hypothetical protein
VITTIGKATQGQTRGLRALGVQVNKGATTQDILNAISAKYSGIASEIAETTGGKFLSAQIAINEKMEDFGYRLLPAVNAAMDFMTTTVIPGVISVLENMGGGIQRAIDESLNPFLEKLGETADLFGISFGGVDQESYWDNVFGQFTRPLDAATQALDLFNEAYKLMLQLMGQPIPGEGGSGLSPMDDKYGFRNLQPPAPSGTGGTTTVVTTVNIGTEKVDKVVTDSIRRTGHGSGRQ